MVCALSVLYCFFKSKLKSVAIVIANHRKLFQIVAGGRSLVIMPSKYIGCILSYLLSLKCIQIKGRQFSIHFPIKSICEF